MTVEQKLKLIILEKICGEVLALDNLLKKLGYAEDNEWWTSEIWQGYLASQAYKDLEELRKLNEVELKLDAHQEPE